MKPLFVHLLVLALLMTSVIRPNFALAQPRAHTPATYDCSRGTGHSYCQETQTQAYAREQVRRQNDRAQRQNQREKRRADFRADLQASRDEHQAFVQSICKDFPQSPYCLRPEMAIDLLKGDEIEFLLAFKGYLKGLIESQGVEIRSKMACLDQPSLSSVQTLTEKTALELGFKKQECIAYRDQEVEELFNAYKEMKVYLALSQGDSRAREYDPTFQNTFLVKPNKGINPNYNNIWCDIFLYPVSFDGVNFCTENFYEIMDITPTHSAIQYQFRLVNEFLLEKSGLYADLPDIAPLRPLTYAEASLAGVIYRDAYLLGPSVSKEFGGQKLQTLLERLNPKSEEYIHLQNRLYYIRSLSALRLRGSTKGSGLFESEDKLPPHAEKEYAKIIAKWPYLVFVEPPTETIQLDCQNNSFGQAADKETNAFCEAWKEALQLERLQPTEYNIYGQNANGETNNLPWRRALKDALQKNLETNKILVERMDQEFNSLELIHEIDTAPTTLRQNSTQKWIKLFAFEEALARFIQENPKYEKSQSRLLGVYNSSKTFKLIRDIGAAVGLGLTCAAIVGTFKMIVPACMLLAGLGVNSYFYATQYSVYQERFLQYFSSPSSELSLIDLELVDEADRALMYEGLFYFVGTGIGDVAKVSRVAMKAKIAKYRSRFRPAGQGDRL